MIIYKITNIVNKKMYIGQTVKSPEERLRKHLLKAKNKVNRYLYDAMNYYGYDNFIIESIDKCVSKSDLNQKEKYWISYYNSNNKEFGYNMTPGGDGGIMSAEIYKKFADMRRGIPLSEDHKRKISESNKGRTISLETRQKISKSNTGKHFSEETKNKIRIFNKGNVFFRGKHHSDKTKQNLSIIKMGKKIHSDKEKEKRSQRWLKEKNPLYVNIDKDVLVEYIKRGLNNVEIASIFKCNPTTIITKIREYFGMLPDEFRKSINITGNRKKEYKIIDFLKLKDLIKCGIIRDVIAKELGISGPQLNVKIEKEYGFGFMQLRRNILNEIK